MDREEHAKRIQKIIAKAWADEAFKQKLIAQPSETLREEGLDVPPEVVVHVVESTDKVFYLVLPPPPNSDEISDVTLEQVSGGQSCSPCVFTPCTKAGPISY